jgi:hypothetical protein
MDFSQINWGLFSGVVSAILLVAWLIVGVRAKAGVIGWIVGLAHLVAAGLNTAAPPRGLLDPSYTLYGFGMLSADDGPKIATMAGAVFLTALVGAFSAVRPSREAMLITAVTSLLFAVVLGWPWLKDLMDGVHVSFQIGDSLTVPGYVAKGVFAIVLVAPFLIGVVWASIRAARAPAA